ncbi:class I SAM-dependent methyltransferase [Ktedonosporobacter rubrisoli]|nr:class I SAM-dependent methyltransferase [Ktedonosporobacter rubrisoli]
MPSKRNDLPRFQRWSKSYETSWLQPVFFEPSMRTVLEVIASYVTTQPESVLDIGCGTGRLLRSLHERWPEAELLGVDPTFGMIEKARELSSAIKFEVSFAEALPVPDASIEVAMSTFSFHHWSDQQAGLREIVRVLKPQGYFFLADAVQPGWLARLQPRSHMQRPEGVRELFQQAGLHVLHQQLTNTKWALVTAGRKELAAD